MKNPKNKAGALPKKQRPYTLCKRGYMARENSAWLYIHDISIVDGLLKAFREHTGYNSNGAAANAWYFQTGTIRCSKHQDFESNRNEIREVLRIYKEKYNYHSHEK